MAQQAYNLPPPGTVGDSHYVTHGKHRDNIADLDARAIVLEGDLARRGVAMEYLTVAHQAAVLAGINTADLAYGLQACIDECAVVDLGTHTWLTGALVVPATRTLRGDQARIVAKTGVITNLVHVQGENVWFCGIDFEAQVYSTFGSTIDCQTLVRVQALDFATGGRIASFRLDACRFIGGKRSLLLDAVDVFDLQKITVYKPYEWGIITQRGCKRGMIRGYDCDGVGLYEGWKLGASAQLVPYEDLIIEDYSIRNCGRLDSNTANWQEGIDLFVYGMDRITIGRGHVINCGNGFVEVKLQNDSTVSPNTINNVTIDGLMGTVDEDKNGISINWTGSAPATADKAGRVVIRNSTLLCTKSSPTSGNAIQVQAYTGVEVQASVHVEGFCNVIRTDGTGSSDSTVRRLRVNGLTARNVVRGIYHSNGTLESLRLGPSNDIEASDLPVQIAGICSDLVMRGGRYVSTKTTSGGGSVQLRGVASALLEDAYIEAEGRPIEVVTFATPSVGGTIRNCTLKGRGASGSVFGAVVNEGAWRYEHNNLEIPDAARGWSVGGTGSVLPYRNTRGTKATTPTTGGSPWDVWGNSAAPAAGTPVEWMCYSAGGSGGASWRGLGA